MIDHNVLGATNNFLTAHPIYYRDYCNVIFTIFSNFYKCREGGQTTCTFDWCNGIGSAKIIAMFTTNIYVWANLKILNASMTITDILNLPHYNKFTFAQPLEVKHSIELNQISFKYEMDSQYVINNLNLMIKPGQSIGLVGSSGSGKSTLVDIL